MGSGTEEAEDNWQGEKERKERGQSMDEREGDEPRRADPKIGRMQCGDQ